MDIDDFERWWRVRERADIMRMIGAVGATSGMADGEVCHARACAEVVVLLRRSGRQRLGCRAAHQVRLAVVEACRRTGVLDDDRDGAVRLARAAGDAARVLVCGSRVPSAEELLAPFRTELPLDLAS
jgi:hypothetical protein